MTDDFELAKANVDMIMERYSRSRLMRVIFFLVGIPVWIFFKVRMFLCLHRYKPVRMNCDGLSGYQCRCGKCLLFDGQGNEYKV